MKAIVLKLAVGAVTFLPAGVLHATSSGNLLINPGAELGNTGWTLGGDFSLNSCAYVTDSSGGVLWPSGGQKLFGSPGPYWSPHQAILYQNVNVQAFDFSSGSDTVTFGGDTQVICGQNGYSAEGWFAVTFFNADNLQLGYVSSGYLTPIPSSSDSHVVVDGYRQTAPIPADTAYIQYAARADKNTTTQCLFGFDNLYLSVDVVPEPNAVFLSVAGLFVLGLKHKFAIKF